MWKNFVDYKYDQIGKTCRLMADALHTMLQEIPKDQTFCYQINL